MTESQRKTVNLDSFLTDFPEPSLRHRHWIRCWPRREPVTKVVELQVPDEVLEERICGRWIHKKSGRSYHVKFAPPKSMTLDADGKPVAESMKDDATGESLMQRADDTSSALVKRLAGYHGETVPILQHYEPNGVVKTVNANQKMDGVCSEVLASLSRK